MTPQLVPTAFFSFDPPSQSWTPHAPSFNLPSPNLTSLRLLTYNTFSSSPSHTIHQARAIFSILHKNELDVIALQEVSDSFERELRKLHWVREGWVVTGFEEFVKQAGVGEIARNQSLQKGGVREGVILMIRKEKVGVGSTVGLLRMPSAPGEGGKAVVVCDLHDGVSCKLRFIASHYTSLPTNVEIRKLQYSLTRHLGATVTSNAAPILSTIILADLNHSTESELSLFLSELPADQQYIDATPTLGSTFGELYPFFTAAYGGRNKNTKRRKPKRVDRILLRGEYECKEFGLVGRENVMDPSGRRMRDRMGADGWSWPSDHEGVMAVITRKEGKLL